jgi:2-polyprenyl-3-methyl-5-hydroxy-6-metoxy-1,4-benzoquinol methylase
MVPQQHPAMDIKQFWEERYTAHPDITGAGALGNSPRFVEFMYAARMRQIERGLRACALRDLATKRVLDVGSGTGAWLAFWRRRGVKHLVGMDFAATSVSILRQQFPDCVIAQGDVSVAPFQLPDQQYDIISSFEVLMHIFDPERFRQAMRNFSTYCAPGGWLIISDPIIRGDRYISPSLTSDYVQFRSLAEYRAALESAGFILRAVRPSTVLLNTPLESRSKTGYFMRARWWRLCRKAQSLLDAPWPIGGLVWQSALTADRVACAVNHNYSPTSKLLFAQKVS